jgi:DNA N-6-adenine-methyltransferase (Dam)
MSLGSHQATIGKSQVHITPRWILTALGRFDLDPCAADPRPWDCARRNFTERDDGLSRPWTGRVFLNPPFNRYGVDRWIQRMAEHNHGIALLHVRPETEWFVPCWRHASGMLFLRKRVIFCKPSGDPQTISNPNSKHFGKPANSGAPVALISFGAKDLQCLRTCGIDGYLLTGWERVGAERRQAAE